MCADRFNWTPEQTGRQTPEQTLICLEGKGMNHTRVKPHVEHMSVEEARRRGIIK
ncbi:MAG: hypothetical protein IID41_14465 [Planctomycetes bacterium]|nr:hypothetical protein [Planctomycetota bacterium]